MNKVTTEQVLRGTYYNPKTGYQSQEKLYQTARKNSLKVSRRKIAEWFRQQDTYTIHKPRQPVTKYQITYVKDLADQAQMDLVDLGNLRWHNKGYYWILTAIELLSRHAFAVPVYHKSTEHSKKPLTKCWVNLKSVLVSILM